MSSSKTPQEVLEEHRQVLGDELGSMYHELHNQFYWLQLKWQEYVELFGKNERRIDLLNDAAPSFFHHVQDVLWDDLLIHLSRLTDQPSSRGKPNLTFAALPALIEGDFQDEVQKLVDQAIVACSFARDWRNRRLAHHDLELALGSPAKALAPASRLAIREALAALHTVMKRISAYYFDSDLQQEVIGSLTGAEHLLYVLRDGVEVQRARRERMQSGELTQDDFEMPPIL